MGFLLKEMEIHQNIGKHPNIVGLVDVFVSDKLAYMVMDRLYGPDLFELVTKHPKVRTPMFIENVLK